MTLWLKDREEHTSVNVELEVEFFDERISSATLPKHKHKYSLRDNDDSTWDPATVEKQVIVNHLGDVVTDVELPLNPSGYLIVDEWCFND